MKHSDSDGKVVAMTGKERLAAVMTGQFPDRVPVWAQLSYGHIGRNGLPGVATPTLEQLGEAEIQLQLDYGFDGIFVTASAPYLPYAADEPWLGFLPQHAGLSRDLAGFEPGDWPAMTITVSDEWAKPYDRARQRYGTTHHIGGWLLDSFTLASVWLGSVQQGMLSMIDYPERFQRLVEYIDQLNIATARALGQRAKVDSVCISSPYAGSSFISKSDYSRYVLPSLSRIVAAVHEAGAIAYLHTCGFSGDRLELEADSGVDGIECMDPPPLGNVELSEAKRRIGQRVFLKGNLDSVNILIRGTDAEVEQEIRRQLAVGQPGGRYILSSACSLAPEVPPERIRLMVELAEQFGQYK
jgi:hypothetical protein